MQNNNFQLMQISGCSPVVGIFLRPGGLTTVQLMSSVCFRKLSISYMLLRTLLIMGSSMKRMR